MATISVIVPVYKVEAYIHRCVDSILTQTFQDLEVILVDDGSPDNCGSICDEYAAKDYRVHVIHQSNGGLSSARNTALKWIWSNSNSEWIAFVDSDDWIHPRFLELLYLAAIENKCQISACKYMRTEAYLPPQEIHIPKIKLVSSVDVYTHGGKGVFAYVWDKLYKKDLWGSIEYPVGRNWEDTATTYKILLKTDNVAFVDAELYFYFSNQDGIVKQQWTPKKLDHLWAIETALKDDIIKNYPFIVLALKKQYLFTLFEQLGQVKESKCISEVERQKYLHFLQRDLRKHLLKDGKKTGITLKSQHWYYDLAFPKISRLYWSFKGVLGRIKRSYRT